ncbi:MAG: energy transducer TonB [Cyanobacteria bacterium P01_D01_bin.156]
MIKRFSLVLALVTIAFSARVHAKIPDVYNSTNELSLDTFNISQNNSHPSSPGDRLSPENIDRLITIISNNLEAKGLPSIWVSDLRTSPPHNFVIMFESQVNLGTGAADYDPSENLGITEMFSGLMRLKSGINIFNLLDSDLGSITNEFFHAWYDGIDFFDGFIFTGRQEPVDFTQVEEEVISDFVGSLAANEGLSIAITNAFSSAARYNLEIGDAANALLRFDNYLQSRGEPTHFNFKDFDDLKFWVVTMEQLENRTARVVGNELDGYWKIRNALSSSSLFAVNHLEYLRGNPRSNATSLSLFTSVDPEETKKLNALFHETQESVDRSTLSQTCLSRISLYEEKVRALAYRLWMPTTPPGKGIWTVVLTYNVLPDSRVTDVKVVQSSAYPPLDESAVQAIELINGARREELVDYYPDCDPTGFVSVSHTFILEYF